MGVGFSYSKKKVLLARLLETLFVPLTWFVARSREDSVRRILIVEPYYLGDAVNLSVMFDALLQHFPDAEIHLLVSSKFAGLYEADPRVAYIHGCDIPWAAYENKYRLGNFRAVELFRLFRRLRTLKFDLGFDVRGEVRNQLLLLLAGCRRRVGSTNYLCSNLQLRGRLLTDSVGHLEPAHISRLNLRLCEAVGCSIPENLTFPVLRPSSGKTAGSSGKTVVHVGGGSKFKKWQTSSWIELCSMLDEVMLIGAPGDLQSLEALQRNVPARPLDIRITSSLQELVDVLYEARLFVGLDSGPANIASLVGCPCVILFGPGVVPLYHPVSPGSEVLHHQDLFPCAPCSQQTCLHPESTCTESIAVGEVLAAMKRARGDG